jgi:hypothetical protein
MSDGRYTTSYPGEPRGAEPAALRYLWLLWKHRFLIAVVSIGPAVAVAVLLSLWPRKYSATHVYERPLSESQYNVLLRRFHSQENLDKLVNRLRERGLAGYAERINTARVEPLCERLIRFEVSPIYPKRLQTTDPATSEQISAFQARLLFVRVVGNSEREVQDAAAVITGNIENVLPIYDIRNDLKESIHRYKNLAAEIEDNRFTLTLDLQREQAKLEKLQGVNGAAGGPAAQARAGASASPADDEASRWPAFSEAAHGNLILQFHDVRNSREFLPLSYQIRAVQSKIIDLQETLNSDDERYRFYLNVLEVNNRLLSRIEESLLSYYTVQQFMDFLGEQLLASEERAVSDYLKSYIRRMENLISAQTRAGEQPVVHPISKGVARNSALAFVVFLMAALFTAVLMEYRYQRHDPGHGLPSDRPTR